MAMTTNSHEQLSVLLDGELPEAELELVLRRMSRDDDLRAAGRRFQLIGDALRDELPPGRPADLVARVRAKLQDAPLPMAESATVRRTNITRLGAGIGIAASVAVVALVALPGRQQEAPPPVLTASEVASPPADQRLMIQPVYTRAAGGGPDRLTRYYVNHTEYAPSLGGRGALTRIIMIQPDVAATDEDQAEPESLLASEDDGSDR
jgi:sigma-E factor negative regulatory protein RseA